MMRRVKTIHLALLIAFLFPIPITSAYLCYHHHIAPDFPSPTLIFETQDQENNIQLKELNIVTSAASPAYILLETHPFDQTPASYPRDLRLTGNDAFFVVEKTWRFIRISLPHFYFCRFTRMIGRTLDNKIFKEERAYEKEMDFFPDNCFLSVFCKLWMGGL